jgi:hypothetical protein
VQRRFDFDGANASWTFEVAPALAAGGVTINIDRTEAPAGRKPD